MGKEVGLKREVGARRGECGVQPSVFLGSIM